MMWLGKGKCSGAVIVTAKLMLIAQVELTSLEQSS